MKDKEKNRIKLKKGLQQLPEHQPPLDLWGKISLGLEQEKKDEVLQAALAKLPQYDPPDLVWENIDNTLSKGKVVKLGNRRRLNWLAAATIVMLIGFTGWWLLGPESEATSVRISYDAIENYPMKRAEDHAAPMINQVIAEAQNVNHTWENPRTVALRKSLEQIKTSIDQFKMAGEQFGMNQHMHEQLTDMYNKRNKIVRALASMI